VKIDLESTGLKSLLLKMKTILCTDINHTSYLPVKCVSSLPDWLRNLLATDRTSLNSFFLFILSVLFITVSKCQICVREVTSSIPAQGINYSVFSWYSSVPPIECLFSTVDQYMDACLSYK